MVDFGGWDMPVQYSGVLDEHHTVRKSVGLFDVSHMGEIEIHGPEALKLVNYVATNDASKLKVGQAHYSALLYEHGGFVDDILVHKVADDSFFLCVNASNQDKDYEHIAAHNKFNASVRNASDRYAQLAIQGPRALNTLQKLTTTPLDSIPYYHFVDGSVCGVEARIARTGYTGEDGFEIYIPPASAERIWKRDFDHRRGIWHQADRPGSAQHSAAGSEDGALWPRNPCQHSALGGGSGLDRQNEQRIFRGPRGCGGRASQGIDTQTDGV